MRFFQSASSLLTEFQSSDLEIDSNRRNKCWIERVLGESKYYARLPNSAIADEKKLEKQVEILLRHFASLAQCYVTVKIQSERGSGEWFREFVERNRKSRIVRAQTRMKARTIS